jgi:ACS family allantoate permease-like MFS transporter
MLVCYCICIGLMAIYWSICVIQNRGVVAPTIEVGDEGAAVESFQDISDFKQEGFKYTT